MLIAAIASLLAAPTHTVCAADEALTADEVSRILAQAAAGAASVGLSANISVVDAEGRSLGLLRMDGAPALMNHHSLVRKLDRRTFFRGMLQ